MIARHVKLKVNKKLTKQLDKHLWHLTGVYNWAIRTIELRKNAGLPYSEFDIYNLVSEHSKKTGISSASIQGTIHTAFQAWQRCWNIQCNKPKRKGNRNKLNSILLRGDCKVNFEDNKIKLPKFGHVRFHPLTKGFPEGKIASQVTLKKKSSGWYVVLLFDIEHSQVTLASTSKIGIDTGFKHLITTSEGEKFGHPRELEASAKQLAKVQRGNGKKKAARLQEKIANQRKDRNHKISNGLVRDHAEIYITNDNLQNQSRLFGKSIASSSLGQLRNMINYKGSSCGRKIIFVDSKNSTVSCSNCSALTGPKGLRNLNIRHWECSACGAEHDRDVNAAINTLNAGQRYCLEVSQGTVSEVKKPKKQLKKLILKNENKSCPGRTGS